MERKEWLRRMRAVTEEMYDRLSPLYWERWGFSADETHQVFLRKFLERIPPGSRVLSAACGAGRYDGLLLEGGHWVVGADQSAGMLARAREHFPSEQFPRLAYEKIGLQELAETAGFQGAFDGLICMDALEHVCPEDYPAILRGFAQVVKPGGAVYFTADTFAEAPEDGVDLHLVYARARERGLPVVLGEWVDELEESYAQARALGPDTPDGVADRSVYHYYAPIEQLRAWIDQSGLVVEEEGAGSGWHHFLARRLPAA